jgi:hypothetical protein
MKIKVKNEREPFHSTQIRLTSKNSNYVELLTVYKTRDFWEAAALLASHCRLAQLEPEKGFFWFIFDDEASCRKISDSYWNGDLVVSAKKLTEAIHSLKEWLFAEKNKKRDREDVE